VQSQSIEVVWLWLLIGPADPGSGSLMKRISMSAHAFAAEIRITAQDEADHVLQLLVSLAPPDNKKRVCNLNSQAPAALPSFHPLYSMTK